MCDSEETMAPWSLTLYLTRVCNSVIKRSPYVPRRRDGAVLAPLCGAFMCDRRWVCGSAMTARHQGGERWHTSANSWGAKCAMPRAH
jgi:hypothetical protein